MTGPDPRDPAYLEHMLEAIARIQRYVGRKRRAGFLGDALLGVAPAPAVKRPVNKPRALRSGASRGRVPAKRRR